MIPDTRWQEFAMCRQYDPEMFFSEGNDKRGRERQIIRVACGVCPVTTKCLEYALGHPEPQYGVWGGLTEKQVGEARRALGKKFGNAARNPNPAPRRRRDDVEEEAA